jgi:hypothetical protein
MNAPSTIARHLHCVAAGSRLKSSPDPPVRVPPARVPPHEPGNTPGEPRLGAAPPKDPPTRGNARIEDLAAKMNENPPTSNVTSGSPVLRKIEVYGTTNRDIQLEPAWAVTVDAPNGAMICINEFRQGEASFRCRKLLLQDSPR